MSDLIQFPEALSLFNYLGLLGFVTYLTSFGALQFRIIDGNSIFYTLLNVLAATLVLISLTVDFNLASALIQITWIIFGVVGLVFRLYRQKVQAVAN